MNINFNIKFDGKSAKALRQGLVSKAMAAFIGFAAACCLQAADSTYWRSDVYTPDRLNRVQEVEVVEILSISPAQIALDNRYDRRRGEGVGALLGAITGAAIGNHNHHDSGRTLAGGLIGGVVGGLAGSAYSGASDIDYAEGVQIVFRDSRGRVYQSAQVGSWCEYRPGSATMVSEYRGETRVQPNNPYGCRRR